MKLNENGKSESTRSYTIKDSVLLAKRRKELLVVATRLFSSRGYSNVSVNDVAVAAEISIGSLYKYVTSKEELLHLIMDEVYSEFETRLYANDTATASVRDSLRSVVARVILAADVARGGIRLMNREFKSLTREHQNEFIGRERGELDAIEEVIRRGVEAGEFSCESPRIAAMNVLSTLVHGWAIERWPLAGLPLNEYTRQQTQLILQMVGCDQAGARPGLEPLSIHSGIN